MWKKISKKIICAALIGTMALSVTACSDSEGEKLVENVKKEGASAVVNGELNMDSPVVSVGESTVSYNEYLVYSWFLKNQYEGTLSADVWNYPLGDVTIEQKAVEDVIRLMIQIKVMNKSAAEQDITLQVDEKEDIDYKADQFLATIPDEVKETNHISKEIMYRIFEENQVAQKMYDVVTASAGANVNEDSLQAVKVLLVHWDVNDSNRDTVKGQAQAIATELGQYPGNFFSFMKDKTGKAPEETIIGSMDAEKVRFNTVTGLKDNTASGLIEEANSYEIAYRLSGNTKAIKKEYREQIIAKEQAKAFQTAYENWAEKYEVKISKSLLAKKQG